jgi:poly(ADP-ribose) glycohydrolase
MEAPDPSFVDPDLASRLGDAPIADAAALDRALDRSWTAGLHAAIACWTELARANDPAYDFYRDTLPKVRAWALDRHPQAPLRLLRRGEPGSLSISPRHARHLLACAFFLGTLEANSAGSLSLTSLYVSQQPAAIERIVCLLAYFHVADDAPEAPAITYARHRLDRATAPRWAALELPLGAARVSLHTGRMEDVPAEVFFDFANRDLHIHAVIPSLTQEEVLFSMCPELFPAILVCERMDDDEVIVMDGARRVAEYSGYLRSFRFEGLRAERRAQEVLAADAVFRDHFSPEAVLRDLDKAWLGFTSCRGRSVSTGHWGCGAFGGNRAQKFLQQSCAAAAAGVSLAYSTYGDDDAAAALGALLASLTARGATVGAVARALCSYGGGDDDEAVARHVLAGA